MSENDPFESYFDGKMLQEALQVYEKVIRFQEGISMYQEGNDFSLIKKISLSMRDKKSQVNVIFNYLIDKK